MVSGVRPLHIISPFAAEGMEICRYVQTVKLTFNPDDLLGFFFFAFC